MIINSLIFLVGTFYRVLLILWILLSLHMLTVLSFFLLSTYVSPSSLQAGMVLNTVALYVFCFRTKHKTTSVIYTINLAVTDLLVNLSLPTRILLYYSGGACLTCSYMHIFSYFVNMYCSILFLTCICVDRYLAIVQVGLEFFSVVFFDAGMLAHSALRGFITLCPCRLKLPVVGGTPVWPNVCASRCGCSPSWSPTPSSPLLSSPLAAASQSSSFSPSPSSFFPSSSLWSSP